MRAREKLVSPASDDDDPLDTPWGIEAYRLQKLRGLSAERTNFPCEVAEAALAHAIDDKVEAAYRRGDLFEKRRRLMEAWAEFCAKPVAAGGVVALRTG